MKRILYIFSLIIAGVGNLWAQDEAQVCIAVVLPDQFERLDAQTVSVLETRMKSIITNAGVASIQNGTFVMYPVVNVLNEEKIEGNVRNMYKLEAEVTFVVCQQTTKAEFGTFTIPLQGFGYAYKDAMKNAFSKINPRDSKLYAWLESCKEKMYSYFTKNLDALIKEARSKVAANQYEEALAILCTYPNTLPGYDRIVEASVDVYDAIALHNCSLLMARAKAAVSVQNYTLASEILQDVSTASPCSSEAHNLLERISSEIKAAQEAEYKAQVEAEERERAERMATAAAEREMISAQQKREYNLERARIRAARDIAKSYYDSLPRVTYKYYRHTYNYNVNWW